MLKQLAFVSLFIGALGCGSSSRGGGGLSFCMPGAENACFCASGEPGRQFCNEEGTEFSECFCGPLDGGVDSGTDSGMDASADVMVDAMSSDAASDGATDTGSDATPDTGSDATPDTGSDATPDTGSDADAGDPPVTGDQHFVIQVLEIPDTSEVPMPGFDLDGTSAAICGVTDFAGGVDNQMARLRSTLDGLVGAGGVNASGAESIANGTVLLLLDVTDGGAAGEVTFTWRRGLVPAGTTLRLEGGRLAPDQTLDIDSAIAPVSATGMRVGSELSVAEDADLTLSVGGLGDFTVRRSRFNGTLRSDGSLTGSLGGSMTIDDLIAAVTPSLPAGITPDTVRVLLGGMADLDDTGSGCESMSIGWRHVAVPYVPGVVR